jgi:hypothetical protein
MILYNFSETGIAHSVERLPTGWTVRGSNAGECEVLRAVQIGHETYPISFTMGAGSFS